VFRAYDAARERLVAIKTIRLDLEPDRVHRLVAEIEQLISAAPAHPVIVRPLATGIEGVTAYLAQEYVAGDSLDVVLRQQKQLSVPDSLRIAAQLAGALDSAGGAGIHHGALHPRDVLLSPDDTKLTGLGIAQALEAVGVPAPVRRPYAAPERTSGSSWGRPADIFGFAALVHEMLWGRRVSGTGDSAAAAMLELPGGDLAQLQGVFARALADDPSRRHESALDFAEALTGAFISQQSAGSSQQQAVGGQPPRAGRRPTTSRRRTMPDAAPLIGLGLIDDRSLPIENAEPFLAETSLVADSRPSTDDLQLKPADAGLPIANPHLQTADRGPSTGDSGQQRTADLGPPTADRGLPKTAEVVDMAPVRAPAPGELSLKPVGQQPAPDHPAEDGRSRSAFLPLAFALIIGIALGFAAGFGVGVRRSGALDEAAVPAADVTTAATTGGAGDRAGQPETPPQSPPSEELQAVAASPPAPAPVTGSLLVRSTPSGALVFVDGREYGRTPITVGSLARGSHRVRVMRQGYVTDERQLTITAAQRAHSVTVRLSPDRPAPVERAAPAAPRAAASAARTGLLVVESRPSGAQVFVDGRLVGTTPMELPALAVGEHAIHLEREGYQRWASAVRVAAAERTRIAASLELATKN
jgi:serine/threonine-protein kinase